jgi:hypothetical protein
VVVLCVEPVRVGGVPGDLGTHWPNSGHSSARRRTTRRQTSLSL